MIEMPLLFGIGALVLAFAAGCAIARGATKRPSYDEMFSRLVKIDTHITIRKLERKALKASIEARVAEEVESLGYAPLAQSGRATEEPPASCDCPSCQSYRSKGQT